MGSIREDGRAPSGHATAVYQAEDLGSVVEAEFELLRAIVAQPGGFLRQAIARFLEFPDEQLAFAEAAELRRALRICTL